MLTLIPYPSIFIEVQKVSLYFVIIDNHQHAVFSLTFWLIFPLFLLFCFYIPIIVTLPSFPPLPTLCPLLHPFLLNFSFKKCQWTQIHVNRNNCKSREVSGSELTHVHWVPQNQSELTHAHWGKGGVLEAELWKNSKFAHWEYNKSTRARPHGASMNQKEHYSFYRLQSEEGALWVVPF